MKNNTVTTFILVLEAQAVQLTTLLMMLIRTDVNFSNVKEIVRFPRFKRQSKIVL